MPIAPFSAASIGIAKKADDAEQAAFQEQQALALLQQAAPANNVGDAAAAVVKSLAPSLSSKAGTTKKVQLVGAKPMTRDQVIAQYESQSIPVQVPRLRIPIARLCTIAFRFLMPVVVCSKILTMMVFIKHLV
ncbi:hypothetical protein SPWS13_2672 [Shewanella putrefaciens]|nr:hypothetical protein SPWS13_2672 [Shewanella putrefaciens]